MKTHYYVEFILFNEKTEFHDDSITNALNVVPSKVHHKGDPINRYRSYVDNIWMYSTPEEEGYNLNTHFSKMLDLFGKQVNVIRHLELTFNLIAKISVVLVIEDGEAPANTLPCEFMKFASEIGAVVEFDIYANPYTESL